MLLDILQQIEIGKHQESIRKVRREMSSQRRIDLQQDDRIALLETQYDSLALCFCTLAKILATKGSVTQEELARLVESVEKSAGSRAEAPPAPDPTSDGITPELCAEPGTCPACGSPSAPGDKACPSCGIALA